MCPCTSRSTTRRGIPWPWTAGVSALPRSWRRSIDWVASTLTLDREVVHLRDSLVPRYAETIYYGFWFAPEREALQTLVDGIQKDVTGTVRLKLYKGTVTVAGRRSPRSLYRTDFVTFEADRVYRQKDAEGFINLNALRLKIRALRDGGR